jgi:hypothetical protein
MIDYGEQEVKATLSIELGKEKKIKYFALFLARII